MDDVARSDADGRPAGEVALRTLIEHTPDGIIVVDAEGVVVLINPAARELLGREDLLGQQLGIPMLSERIAEVDLIGRLGEARVAELRLVDLAWNGHPAKLISLRDVSEHRRLETDMRQAYDDCESIVRARTAELRREVSERRRAENAFRNSEERLHSLISNLHDMVLILDATGIVLYAIPSVERALGWRANELMGHPLFDLCHPDDRPEANAAFTRTATTVDQPFSAEFRVRTVDGQWRHLEVIGTNLLHVPHIGGLVVTGRDVTRRKAIEMDLRSAKAQAEDAYRDLKNTQDSLIQAKKMAALGGLVAGVAHEINTPVGIALSSASLLAQKTEKVARAYADGTLVQTDFEDYLGTASEASRLLVSSCDRAAELIRSFKQVAVDQTGGERRSFQLKEYIGEILLSLEPRLKKTPHTISVGCAPDLILDTNPGLLSQSLTNLVMNSLIHAFDEGVAGRISITVSTPDPDMVEILYTDNGRGIPQDIQGKVFDPFFTTRRGDGGSGLGLHIVYNAICSGLKGSISLDSAPETGTAFTLRIPRVLPNARLGARKGHP